MTLHTSVQQCVRGSCCVQRRIMMLSLKQQACMCSA